MEDLLPSVRVGQTRIRLRGATTMLLPDLIRYVAADVWLALAGRYPVKTDSSKPSAISIVDETNPFVPLCMYST